MFVMDNAVRDYAWGSRSRMAEFLGRTPGGGPEAELWIGAHDLAPSRRPDGRPLNEVVADDPDGTLGGRVRDIFGDRLPFLMKVLAVDAPLSLQVHPSSERARIGHAREDAAGVPVDDPARSYRDRWHKPELVFALTRFEGLAGFRDVARSAQVLRRLGRSWTDDLARRLTTGPAYQALRSVVSEVLALAPDEAAARVAEVTAAAERCAAPLDDDAEAARSLACVAGLGRRYPDDPAVVVALLLNNVLLMPGEAMFVDSGVIHAYVAGFGIEVMASSDNVVRAGLTAKHRNVEGTVAVANFTPIPPPRWNPAERALDHVCLEPPVAEFALTVGRTPLRRVAASGPRAVLVVDGEVELVTAAGRLTVRRGRSVFLGHADGPVDVQGDGRVAVVSVPV